MTLLLSILTVFLGLIGLEYIDPLPALAGYLLVVVVALLIPGAVEIANPAAISAEAGDSIRDSTVRQVADALPDPCLILDGRSIIIHRNAAAIGAFPNLIDGTPIAFSMRSPAMLSAIEAVRRSGRPQTVELHQTVPNETWHKVSVAQFAGWIEGLPFELHNLGDWGHPRGQYMLEFRRR